MGRHWSLPMLRVFVILLLLVISSSALDSAVVCPGRCQEPSLGEGARIFYFVAVHSEQTMQDAVHLIRAIRDPRNTILIHVDKKAKGLLDDETRLLFREIKECPCGSEIRIESRFNVEWSKWSMNLPTLWALQVAVEEYSEWDVFINLSGDTLPVFSTDTMAIILPELPYNFVTSRSCETGLLPTNVYRFPSFWHKRRHYTKDETERDPVFEVEKQDGSRQKRTVTTHFGSQWMILQRPFCEWIISERRKLRSLPTLYEAFLMENGFLMADETYFASLLMHADEFRDTLPKLDEKHALLWRNGTTSGITAVRFERMDEHVPTAFGYLWDQQRYDVPESSTASKPRVWGPYFLGVYDLFNIRESGALFVRKVSEAVDPNMIQLLPVDSSDEIPPIQWPDEVKIEDKPDWEAFLTRLEARAAVDDDDAVDNTDDDEIESGLDESVSAYDEPEL